VAAYKLAPKGALTSVVQSIAKPAANVFTAARNRLAESAPGIAQAARAFALDETGSMRIAALSALKTMGLEGVDLAGRSFNTGRKALENAGFSLTETTATGRKVFTHPKTGAKVMYDSGDALVGNQAPHWHIFDKAGNQYGRSGRVVSGSENAAHIPAAR
jgi:hypothetical protein